MTGYCIACGCTQCMCNYIHETKIHEPLVDLKAVFARENIKLKAENNKLKNALIEIVPETCTASRQMVARVLKEVEL